ncbi:Zinc finger transcription factor Trps1 [Frankliniella fusca]|uniref:Zinc finger transcription factor Trps1 n=1 Tax=Frankliniella fusca TaxID=407009 RepID=A0AAE1LCG1_9NEOP|nr:Zinc finger transcription factor Trps1 [Frankliniella fusca]
MRFFDLFLAYLFSFWLLCSSARRASIAPEVTQPPTYVVPYQRSKSRSVDHGFSPPFDLDSLRHTVEGRIQSAEKLSRAGE